MIDLIPFLKIFPVVLMGVMSPGPSFLMVTNVSLMAGRIEGIKCGVGMATGTFVLALLSIWGLGLLEQIQQIIFAIKIIGGLYLIYLGFNLWQKSMHEKEAFAQKTAVSKKQFKTSYLTGFITNLTNPKTVVFYTSLFTLALDQTTSLETKIGLPFFCAAISFLWYNFVAVALSVPRLRARYQKWAKTIDRGAGTILLLFGAKLVLSGKS